MHERTVGQLLDLAADLFVRRFAATVGMTFLMWLPVRLSWAFFEGRTSGLDPSGSFLGSDSSFAAGLAPLHTLAAYTVQAIAIALVIHVVYAELQGRPATVRRVLMGALRRAPALLAMTAITSGLTLLGLLCCFLPGMLLAYLWSVAPAALVLEGLGPIASLMRSQSLVRRNFVRWSGVTSCVVVLQLSFETSVLAMDLDAAWIPKLEMLQGVRVWLEAVLSALLLAISSAGGAIVVTTFYLDCRVRGEGFDLAMRLERLQMAPAEPRARLA